MSVREVSKNTHRVNKLSRKVLAKAHFERPVAQFLAKHLSYSVAKNFSLREVTCPQNLWITKVGLHYAFHAYCD